MSTPDIRALLVEIPAGRRVVVELKDGREIQAVARDDAELQLEDATEPIDLEQVDRVLLPTSSADPAE